MTDPEYAEWWSVRFKDGGTCEFISSQPNMLVAPKQVFVPAQIFQSSLPEHLSKHMAEPIHPT